MHDYEFLAIYKPWIRYLQLVLKKIQTRLCYGDIQNKYKGKHSDAEIDNFARLHLEYRYGCHFVVHSRPKNFSFFFNFIGVGMLDSAQWDIQNSTHIDYQYSLGIN